MLNNFPIYPTIPVTDIEKAKQFYEDVLGLKAIDRTGEGVLFEAGKDTKIYIYKRTPSKADHTLAGFSVEDIEKVVDQLLEKGVKFEQYNVKGWIETNEKGIAEMDGAKSAWFKDPDGNILAVNEM